MAKMAGKRWEQGEASVGKPLLPSVPLLPFLRSLPSFLPFSRGGGVPRRDVGRILGSPAREGWQKGDTLLGNWTQVGKVKKRLCHRCNHLVHLTHPRTGPPALTIEIGGAGGGVPL